MHDKSSGTPEPQFGGLTAAEIDADPRKAFLALLVASIEIGEGFINTTRQLADLADVVLGMAAAGRRIEAPDVPVFRQGIEAARAAVDPAGAVARLVTDLKAIGLTRGSES